MDEVQKEWVKFKDTWKSKVPAKQRDNLEKLDNLIDIFCTHDSEIRHLERIIIMGAGKVRICQHVLYLPKCPFNLKIKGIDSEIPTDYLFSPILDMLVHTIVRKNPKIKKD